MFISYDSEIFINSDSIMFDNTAQQIEKILSEIESRNIDITTPYDNWLNIGFGFADKPLPPTSDELLSQWKPYIDSCIEIFGSNRCMFESNFPVDKGTCSYAVLWNCFKKATLGLSVDEKRELFFGTANKAYRLNLNQ
jgi:hypothetical protein